MQTHDWSRTAIDSYMTMSQIRKVCYLQCQDGRTRKSILLALDATWEQPPRLVLNPCHHHSPPPEHSRRPATPTGMGSKSWSGTR